jgi:hypothetical protein
MTNARTTLTVPLMLSSSTPAQLVSTDPQIHRTGTSPQVAQVVLQDSTHWKTTTHVPHAQPATSAQVIPLFLILKMMKKVGIFALLVTTVQKDPFKSWPVHWELTNQTREQEVWTTV